MKPLWIVLGIILEIAAIYLGITYLEDNWLVLIPMGTLLSIGGMLIFFGVTLQGKAKQQAVAQQQSAAAQQATAKKAADDAKAAAEQASDPTAQLKKLADLHASGVLTDEEYAAAKKKVLGI
jgi:ABC-type bacteriocin/lantibiotic exporter with double-glycine peptidase domain